MSRSTRRRWAAAVFTTMAVLMAFTTLLPLVWMFSSALKKESEVLANPLNLIPFDPQWGNFESAFQSVAPFLRNSIMLAAINVTGVLIVSSLAGFAFARLKFWGREILFGIILATTMIPSIAYLIPQYIMFDQWKWIDTWLPLFAPRVLTPVFATFLMRQAFKMLPQELEDAARIDGASTFLVFFRVFLPLTKPSLAAVAVLTFVESWNDLFGPLIFINSSRLQTLPAALALFRGEFFTSITLLMAAATISVVPVLLVYFFGQRYLVQGVSNTGMTG